MAKQLKTLNNKNRKINDFMKIQNKDNSSADMYIYGDIVSSEWSKWEDTDVAPEDVRNFLSQINNVKNLNVYINSGGGSVFAGLNIYNMLKRHEATVNVHVDGLAGSIASIIAMAADNLYIPSNAFLMIHKPLIGIYGNAFDFEKAIQDLNAIESGLMNIYAENLTEGTDIADIQAMVDAETWLNGKEAANYFNVQVVEANKTAAAASEYFNQYKHIPEALKAVTDENEASELIAKDELQKLFDQMWQEKLAQSENAAAASVQAVRNQAANELELLKLYL